MKSAGTIAAVTMAMALCGTAWSQSLLRPREESAMPVTIGPSGAPSVAPNADLKAMSMMYIDPPKARMFAVHEQITILIDENSQQQSKESLETKKDASFDASLKKFPDIHALLDGQLRNKSGSPLGAVSAADSEKWKGEGTYSRNDRFTAKITAKIIDVKPNGLLVLEARKTIQTNSEIKTMVMSGTCRGADITSSNTVLSTQLADLNLVQNTEGELKDSSSKGWITGVLEAVFNF